MSVSTKTNLDPTEKGVMQAISLDDPSLFLNRELSWIRFNARVLEEANDPWHPLLERVKFLAICGSNLDEFFMTRIPRLLKKIKEGSDQKSMDGKTAKEQIEAVRNEILPLLKNHARCWKEKILPALAKEGIYIRRFNELTSSQKLRLREYFKTAVLPVMKEPKAGILPSSIKSLQINLLLCKDTPAPDSYWLVPVQTEAFGRLIRVPKAWNIIRASSESADTDVSFVFLEDLLMNNLDQLFPDQQNLKAYPFRLTRNGEVDVIMDESSDFLLAVKKSLLERKAGFPSRLEFDQSMPADLKGLLTKALDLSDNLLFDFDGPLSLVDFWQLNKMNRPDIKDTVFIPNISPLLTAEKSLFKTISKRDIVLYHPYDGFEIIINLLREAAQDPKVMKIFITIYRMDPKSPVIDALIEAAKKRKKVTAIIELKAKFDEEHNIALASKLREAGVNPVYNFPNIKVHAKLCLIERKEKKGVIRYSHIGSGNYNALTAKIYGDIGYLTARPEVGEELSQLFNIIINGLQEKEFKHLLVAPRSLKNEILKRIERIIAFHSKSGKGYIAFKVNNLEEKSIIQALYRASMAGIKVDLNVRGLCCLKPGIKGVSDNISVISIVGRFLEHARIYYFHDGENDEVLIGSSDLMFRNLNERIEVLFSVPDPKLRHAIMENMLKVHLRDNVKARRLLSDGTYERLAPKERKELTNSQLWLIQNRGIWHEQAS